MTARPLICAALRVEARAARRGWPGAPVTAIGMRARRLSAVTAHVGPVVLLGFGGGLDAAQRPGDVVVATEIRTPEGRVALPASGTASRALRRAGVDATSGPLWCSDRIVRGSRRDALAGSAIAVDMESAKVAAACDRRQLIVVRVIVDTPRQGLVRASIFGGRQARRALRFVASALAAATSDDDAPPTRETINSGTVTDAATSGSAMAGETATRETATRAAGQEG